jgi:ADP-ribose pyrophosphatase YjhB (NUDIX family)
MPKRNLHCSFCGHAFPIGGQWPRTCDSCGNISEQLPKPMVAVILPVHDNVVLVRHGREPLFGKLALPTDVVRVGESWQQAGARALKQESAVVIQPEELSLYEVVSGLADSLLVVGIAKSRTAASMPRFVPNERITELVLASSPLELAFPAHSLALKRFLSQHRHQQRRRRTSHAE